MNVTVEARHLDVTQPMRQYIESKVEKLPRFYEGIQSVEVILDMEADHAVVEIVVQASRKHTFVASHRDEDMYACTDRCVDKIITQLRRHKDRLRNRHGAPRGKAFEEPGQ